MGTNNTIKTHTKQTGIKFIQVNLQHYMAAIANLMKAVAEDETEIIFIQEPHTIQGKQLEFQQYTKSSHQATIVVEQQW